MKKIILFFALLLVVSASKAQDDKAVKEAIEKSKYKYAFVYVNIKTDTLFVFYDNGEYEPICRMTFTNINKGIGNSYNKIMEGFGRYVSGFKYLEAQGYDFVGTGNYLYGEFNVPYYMFRKKKE